MILKILIELSNTNSRKEKEVILLREKNNELLKRVFRLAFDPTINFYIKKIPQPQKSAITLSLNDSLDFIEQQLAKRIITGNEARDEFAKVLGSLSPEDAKVLSMIIDRDLRCGVNENTINKIWKKLIPEFPYQRCELLKSVKIHEWPWNKGIISQLKADGSFTNMIVMKDSVLFMTRNGTVYPEECFQNIKNEISQFGFDNVVFHGELLVFKNGKPLSREISNGKLNSLSKGGNALEKDEEVKFLVWDSIPYDEFLRGFCNITYDMRLETLKVLLEKTKNIQLIETKIVYSFDEALAHYHELIAKGYEGTIIKRPDGVWKNGTSKDQVKLKIDCDIDLRMQRLNPGKGKNATTFGSIYCISECEQFEVNVSGFKDNERIEIARNWELYKGKIITVRINNIMKPSREDNKYSAFLPRFIEIREDKSEADTLEQIIKQFESIVKYQ